MDNMLNFLGRDSGFGKYNTSAFIEIDDKFILFDCGFTTFQILKERFDFNKYNEIVVFITHLHNDHAGSLSQFILYLWFVYHKKVLVISKCKNIKQYLEITGTTSDAYIVKDKYDDCIFIPTIHVKELDCYGIKLRLKDKYIIYSGDTKILDSYLPYVENVSEIYLDVSRYGGVHLKFEDIIDDLKELKNKGIRIILMHIDDYEYISKINNNEFIIA